MDNTPDEHELDTKILDTPENRKAARDVAFAYLKEPKYRWAERYPWKTFFSSLSSDLDEAATLNNIYFVEGLGDTPDYFSVVITLTSESKPAVVQVGVAPPQSASDKPSFYPLQSDAIAVGDRPVAAIAITRLSSLPAGDVIIKLQRNMPTLRFGDPAFPPPTDEEFKLNLAGARGPVTLVWTPCLQSFSPFLPFYKLNVRGVVRGLDYVYLRADFKVDSRTMTADKMAFVTPTTNILGM